MIIGWPQGIVLFLIVLGLGIDLAKHGKTEIEKHNFFFTLSVQIMFIALLYWGGFFA